MSYLPSTFISAEAALIVQEGLNATREAFLESTSAAPAERLRELCGVCPFPIAPEEGLANAKCPHLFHHRCMNMLRVSYHNECPICQTEWWSSGRDVRSAREVLKIRTDLEINGRFRAEWVLSSPLTPGHFPNRLRDLVCNIAYGLQVQDSSRHDWTDPSVSGKFSDPEARAAGLKMQALMRDVASSVDGRRAMDCMLQCVLKLPYSLVKEYVATEPKVYRRIERKDYINVICLVEDVEEMIHERWEDRHPSRRMSASVKEFVHKIMYFALTNIAKEIFRGLRSEEGGITQEQIDSFESKDDIFEHENMNVFKECKERPDEQADMKSCERSDDETTEQEHTQPSCDSTHGEDPANLLVRDYLANLLNRRPRSASVSRRHVAAVRGDCAE
ncbi:uncharacterized protein RCC_07972 [Ramularia collo-cygni]|uniref:RING-type domain-containing protein n=1 Tax=Ramularia collo-cygni TaxID=112498 RepID=A0A2D3VLJ2_9PEZI|nr:uncharacterized protein RCC_07972 [Ramularia collo-cygni]CZT22103.1 uncharacterized protein RCC_07972 [Ramularia collo-cygni]